MLLAGVEANRFLQPVEPVEDCLLMESVPCVIPPNRLGLRRGCVQVLHSTSPPHGEKPTLGTAEFHGSSKSFGERSLRRQSYVPLRGRCGECQRNFENRSCVGNDVIPASAFHSAVSSSLTKSFGAAVLNSATHDTL